MTAIRHILHPTDFSDASRYAFCVAATLAQAYGAALTVLHVNATPGPMVPFGETLAGLQPEPYRQWLTKILRRFEAPGVAVEYKLAEGDPVREIVKAAVAGDCDLVVMGTHGRTGLARLVIGSVAEQVLRKAPCAVLTVRAPHGPGPAEAVRVPVAAHAAAGVGVR